MSRLHRRSPSQHAERSETQGALPRGSLFGPERCAQASCPLAGQLRCGARTRRGTRTRCGRTSSCAWSRSWAWRGGRCRCRGRSWSRRRHGSRRRCWGGSGPFADDVVESTAVVIGHIHFASLILAESGDTERSWKQQLAHPFLVILNSAPYVSRAIIGIKIDARQLRVELPSVTITASHCAPLAVVVFEHWKRRAAIEKLVATAGRYILKTMSAF